MEKKLARFVTFALAQEIGGVTRSVLAVDERWATKFSQQFMLSNGLCRPRSSVYQSISGICLWRQLVTGTCGKKLGRDNQLVYSY